MSDVKGTVRIFLLPQFDEKNSAYSYENARKRAFELDRFVVSCKCSKFELQMRLYYIEMNFYAEF